MDAQLTVAPLEDVPAARRPVGAVPPVSQLVWVRGAPRAWQPVSQREARLVLRSAYSTVRALGQTVARLQSVPPASATQVAHSARPRAVLRPEESSAAAK
jgi:hypothetical protein